VGNDSVEWPELREHEELLNEPTELLWRQVHPQFYNNGQVTHAANANRDPSDEWCSRCDEHLNSDVHAVDAQPGDRVRGTGVQTGMTRVGVFDGTRSIPTGDSVLIHLDSGLPAWVLVDSVEVVSRKEQQA
jgi:hypothetical protein